MNKKRTVMISLLLVASLNIGCQNINEEVAESVETVVIEEIDNSTQKSIFVKSEKLTETTDSCNVELDIPILEGFNNTEFQDSENERIATYIADYSESIKQMAIEIKEEGYLTTPYYVGVAYDILYQSDHYLSLEITYNEFTGGAHGNYFSEYLVYDLNREALVSLKDIVRTDMNYMAVINQLLDERIQAKRSESEYGDLLHSWYEGVTEELLSFSILEEGLGIHFQPYEIGPYAEGAPSFVLAYDQLEGILKTNDF